MRCRRPCWPRWEGRSSAEFMRLSINLASRPYENARRFYLTWLPGVIVLGLVTAGLCHLAYLHYAESRSVQHELTSQRKQVDQLDKERSDAEATLALPQNSGTRDQAQFLNTLFARKAFSWTKVLADLETIMPAGVQVVSIKPSITADGQTQFNMTVSTGRREDAIELVRRMETSPRFVQPAMVSEKFKQDPKGDLLTVEIVSQYVPAPRRGTS